LHCRCRRVRSEFMERFRRREVQRSKIEFIYPFPQQHFTSKNSRLDLFEVFDGTLSEAALTSC
jgi:hypothetical protein